MIIPNDPTSPPRSSLASRRRLLPVQPVAGCQSGSEYCPHHRRSPPLEPCRCEWKSVNSYSSGGSSVLVCLPCSSSNDVERTAPPPVSWSPDGKFLYLKIQESIYAIPLRPSQMLPPIPASGFRSKEEVAAFPGCAADSAGRSISRPRPVHLRFHEGFHAPQYLSGSGTLMRSGSQENRRRLWA